MTTRFPTVAWLVLALTGGAAPATAAAVDGVDPLFESLEPLSVRISGPLRSLARDRSEDPKYRPASFTYQDAAGNERVFQIQLRPRGLSRRTDEVCDFPPLRVNFKKKQLDGSVFDGQDKLKLVSYCRRSDRHDRFVFKEYLAYRLLNTLTDASFRVRALDVEYVDEDRRNRVERRFGFFIEDKERLARRLGLTVFEQAIAPGHLEPEHTTLMELYQFMIGNTDFSFIAGAEAGDCCHNTVLMVDADGHYAPMPYDFDISGLVNPPYAVVDFQLPIRTVRQRLFRGFCRDAAVFERAVERFRRVRQDMLHVLATETELDDRSRTTARAYVEQFYAILDDPKARQRYLLDECRG